MILQCRKAFSIACVSLTPVNGPPCRVELGLLEHVQQQFSLPAQEVESCWKGDLEGGGNSQVRRQAGLGSLRVSLAFPSEGCSGGGTIARMGLRS